MKKYVLLFLISMSQQTYAVKTSGLLLSAFCSDVGSQTQQAINQSQRLDDIVEQLESDDACKGIAQSTRSLLANIQSLRILEEQETESENLVKTIARYEEEIDVERARLTALNIGTVGYIPTSDYLTSLELRFNELRLSSFEDQLSQGFTSNTEDKKIDRIKLLGANLNSVLSSLSTSNACTSSDSNRSLGPQILSSVLGLAATAVAGVAGVTVALTSEVITSTAGLIRSIHYKDIKKGIETNEMKVALSCSLEGIANTYCKANDSLNLIKYHVEKESKVKCESEDCLLLKSGVDLIAKKSSSLNSWINLIFSGATPRNTSQVGPYQEAIELRARFNVLEVRMRAQISQARDSISRAESQPNSETRINNIIRNLMTGLAFTSGSFNEAQRSPYSEFFSEDSSCGSFAYFFDPDNSDSRNLNRTGSEVDDSCRNVVRSRFENRVVSLDELEARVGNLNTETAGNVAFTVQLVAEENTSNLLLQYVARDNIFKSSPKNFMDSALLYYKNLKKYLLQDDVKRTFLMNIINRAEKQIRLTQKVINYTDCSEFEKPIDEDHENSFTNQGEIINSLLERSSRCDLEATKLTKISIILAPNQQVLSVQGSLKSIFEQHVEIAKSNGDITDDNLLFILNTSDEDSSSVLVRNAIDIQNLFEDSTNAMSVTKGNLKNFWGSYSDAIYKTAKSLKDSDDQIVLGRLCVRAALAPLSESRIKKLTKHCQGTSYVSTNRKVSDIQFDDIVKLKFEEKACKVYDFQRELRFLNNKTLSL